MNQIQYKQRDCKDKVKIEQFLQDARIGIIGMNGDDVPYAVPVNFVWYEGSIFFHGMGSGKKEKILSKGPPVCFIVYEEYGTVTDPIPCHADTSYMSVMLFGRIEKIVDFEESSSVLQKLLDKYTPAYYKKPLTSKMLENYRSSIDGNPVSVFKLKPDEITAKENPAPKKEFFNRE